MIVPQIHQRPLGPATIVLFVLLGGVQVEASELVPIFDGKTFDGWTVMPVAERAAWSVENGIIIAKGAKDRSYLVYDRHDIADLEMTLEYRFPKHGNSGISIRAQVDETGKRDFKSYHADFGHVGIGPEILGAWDFHTPGRTEHACFRGTRLVIDRDDHPHVTPIPNSVQLSDIHQGDWNQVRVVARDNHFQLFINGKLASEFIEHLEPARRLARGMVQLQLHDAETEVHFRNIRLRVLD